MIVDAREIQCNEISARECAALRLLAADGWPRSEIAFMFERDARTIARHVDCECAHEHELEIDIGGDRDV